MRNTKLASLVGAAAAFTALVYLWSASRDGEAAQARGVRESAARPELAQLENDPRRDATSAATRYEAPLSTDRRSAPRLESGRWAPPSFEYELEVRVFDEFDEPGLKERVFLAPAAHTLNEVGAADLDGRLVVRWLGFEPHMQVDVALAQGQALRRVDVRAGFTSVALPRRAGATAPAASAKPGQQRVETPPKEASTAKRAPPVESAPTARRDGEGRLQFVEPLLYASQDTAVVVRRERGDVSGFSASQVDRGTRRAKQSSGVADPAMGLIFGRFVDADGAPVAGARLVAELVGGGWRPTTRTDEQGAYRLRNLLPGEWDLRAGGGDFGRAAARVRVSAGQTTEWSATLERGHELKGRLVDNAQAPLAGWSLLAETFDGSNALVDVATADDQGRFAIPNLPYSALRLLARRRESAPGSEFLVGEGLWPSERVQEFVLDTRADFAPGTILLRMTCDEGTPPGIATARAWREGIPRGVAGVVSAPNQRPAPFGELTLFERGLACASLESGWYSLEIAAAGRELLTVPRVFVPAAQTLELPALQASLPATLAVGGAGSAEELPIALEFVHRGAAVELRCSATEVRGGRGFLRPGDYHVEWTHGASRHERWLHVEVGAAAELQ